MLAEAARPQVPLQHPAHCDGQCAGRLNAILEEQARAIGQALHDEAGQLLVAAFLALADVSRDMPPSLAPRLRAVQEHLAGVEEGLRRVAHELHPRRLEEEGIVNALRFLAHGFATRHGIAAVVQARVPRRMPDAVAAVLYRVAQETLANVARHAQATRVVICVRAGRGAVRCTIRDDGIGFDVREAARGHGLGLGGMRARLAAVGGTLAVRSGKGAGTSLTATIPTGH